jgi:hypothetical protein
MEKFLYCSPTPSFMTFGILKAAQEKKGLANRIQERKEKRGTLEKEYQEAQEELVYRRREINALTKNGGKLRDERDGLQNLSRRQHFEKL